MPDSAAPSVDDLVGIVPPNRMRVGRKVGRTIYEQYGPEPTDDDPLIGVMDTPELAAEVVKSVNRKRGFDV